MEELYHHGIKGMRWGIRRFQNKDGTLTETGKKRQKENDISEDPETKKAKIKSSMSAKEVYENRHLFTDREIQEAFLRLNNEKKIKELIPEHKSKGEKFVDDLIKWGNKASDLANTGSKMYDSYKKVEKILKEIENR